MSEEHAKPEPFGAAVTAEFIGGPRDGVTMELPRLEHRWLLPVIKPLTLDEMRTLGAYPDPSNPLSFTPIAVYDLALDPEMKRPSLNDEGRYRYEFKGYR